MESLHLLISTTARTSFIMSSFHTDSPFTGLLPYHLASRLCQAQAQQHTQVALWERFPTLTAEHWNQIFNERRPLLWVDEQAQAVVVAEEFLPRLVSWAAMYEATLSDPLPQSNDEARYLARQLEYYCNLAGRLVAVDPNLTHHDSIESMRAVFFRLCVGNDVAERLSERP
jgi:hypothetical protein